MAVEAQIIKIEAAHDNFRSRALDNSDAQLFYVDNLVRKRRSYSGRRRLSYSGDAIAVGLPPAALSTCVNRFWRTSTCTTCTIFGPTAGAARRPAT